MIVWREEAWTFDVDTPTTIRRFIQRDETISLMYLMQCTGTEFTDCLHGVQTCVEAGLVEWIRPVADDAVTLRNVGLVYCRWRGAGDGAYRWEQDFFEGRRPGRFRTAQE